VTTTAADRCRAGRKAAGAGPGRRLVALLWLVLAAWPLAQASLARGAPAGGAGCGSSAVDSRIDNPPLDLFPVDTTILTTVFHHPCPGPIVVETVLTAGRAPTALEDAFVKGFAVLTCSGGGCPVTGTPISADVPGATGFTVDKTRPSELLSIVITSLFSDVPAGLYVMDVAVSGQHSSLLIGQAHVIGSGTGGAGRPPGP
jgi:hypothetical protein